MECVIVSRNPQVCDRVCAYYLSLCKTFNKLACAIMSQILNFTLLVRTTSRIGGVTRLLIRKTALTYFITTNVRQKHGHLTNTKFRERSHQKRRCHPVTAPQILDSQHDYANCIPTNTGTQLPQSNNVKNSF